jgi:MFS family permease
MKVKAELIHPHRYRWAVLFTSLLAFIAFAFVFQLAPPLIQSIKAEFDIASEAQGALLMSAVLIPGIFLSLPAGLFIRRYGTVRVGSVSLIFVITGSLVSATANSFTILLVGRMVLGIGGASIFTTTPAIIAQWFAEKNLGKAMGIFGVNMPLATVIAFPSASLLMNTYGWRLPFYVGFAVAVSATAIFVAVVKEGPFSQREIVTSARQAIGNPEIWKLSLVWLCFQAAALSFTTWGPTLFERFRSVLNVQASVCASLLSWAAIFCVPVFGYMSDRTGRRRLFAMTGLFLMTLAYVALAFTSSSMLVTFIVGLGVAAAMVPPMVSSLPPEILGQYLASVGFGMTTMCANVGATLAQPLVGLLLDFAQAYSPCLLGMASVSAVGAITAFALKTR